ncbi:hypothetical protein [Flavobacterium sp. WV_118_3]|uniref:hypothetical protein n=1 Tax=Flavobacterium sp. WV_118_3 TaxID=3151764 RepID=UPI0012CBF002|nr:hypothetical protein [Flavobacterium sp.]
MKSLFVLSVFLFSALTLNNNDKIKIEGLKKSYNQNQNIEFTINNNSEKKYYYISIEYYDNRWIELINDISQPESRVSVINLINPHQIVKKNISIKKVFYLKNFLMFKKFRLKIVYGKSSDEINTTYFSNSFEII